MRRPSTGQSSLATAVKRGEALVTPADTAFALELAPRCSPSTYVALYEALPPLRLAKDGGTALDFAQRLLAQRQDKVASDCHRRSRVPRPADERSTRPPARVPRTRWRMCSSSSSRSMWTQATSWRAWWMPASFRARTTLSKVRALPAPPFPAHHLASYPAPARVPAHLASYPAPARVPAHHLPS